MGPVALVIFAAGSVLAVEGLILALAPGRIDSLLDLIRRMPAEMRRNLGLVGLALGLALVWLALHLVI
ncbi:MAG: DUF2065 family protein [Defluviimonas sp.]|uniref:DUF2065 family protein n=1 Tax=Albidovulum sp. TaxID=1872424 RepID=UPI001D5EC2B5|nr:DUF2065 family protein [Paracoccaceae bacterium]MCC0063689.1 DUF2065 family protein [Defluviimonas sp.]